LHVLVKKDPVTTVIIPDVINVYPTTRTGDQIFCSCFFQLKQQYKEKNIAKRIEYPEVYLSAYSLITISVL
jgi:hypothetical protein